MMNSGRRLPVCPVELLTRYADLLSLQTASARQKYIDLQRLQSVLHRKTPLLQHLDVFRIFARPSGGAPTR
jgi:hypothetical protein